MDEGMLVPPFSIAPDAVDSTWPLAGSRNLSQEPGRFTSRPLVGVQYIVQ